MAGQKTVRDYIFSGGLDGRVFVDPIGEEPYVFLGPPMKDGEVEIHYVSNRNILGSSTRVTFIKHLNHSEYDSNSQNTSPRTTVDEKLLRRVRLIGVGD